MHALYYTDVQNIQYSITFIIILQQSSNEFGESSANVQEDLPEKNAHFATIKVWNNRREQENVFKKTTAREITVFL